MSKPTKQPILSGPEHPPSETHPACVKCELFKTAVTPFWDSFYEENGKIKVGMPDYAAKGGWILVVGDGVSKEMDEEERLRAPENDPFKMSAAQLTAGGYAMLQIPNTTEEKSKFVKKFIERMNRFEEVPVGVEAEFY